MLNNLEAIKVCTWVKSFKLEGFYGSTLPELELISPNIDKQKEVLRYLY